MDDELAPLHEAHEAARHGVNTAAAQEPAGRARPSGSPALGKAALGSTDLSNLLKRQHLVITRGQALQCGLSHDAIQRRTRTGGRWQRLLPGVYLTVTGTSALDQRDTAALLYAGPGSTLTGLAALRWHAMRAPRLPGSNSSAQPNSVDVLVPARRIRRSIGFVVVHQTRRLPPQVCYLGPVQYALPARAVADAARGLDDLADVRSIVAAAVQSRRCTVEQLIDELRNGPIRGSAHLRTALAEVAQGARSGCEAELHELIRRGGLPVPLFNPQLYCGDGLLAIPDAWWPDAGVAVEVDSKEWHLTPEDWERTMRRHAMMTALGILVLHFSPRQIRNEPREVVSAIRLAIESRSGQPCPAVRTVLVAA